jgi:gliding motility-associated-like protein
MTSSAVCATPPSATSNSIAITVSPGGPAQVSISSTGSTICLGASVTFTATPTNGGPSPTYQWQVNGSNVGTNSPTYTTNTLTNGDLVKVIMTSSLTCAIGSPATSNTITMVVNSNITPAVALVASPNGAICAGTSVTFTATAINTGGGNVTYDFKVNGGSVQNSTLNTYTTVTLTNGNIVTCDITVSAGACLTSTTATSNTITMTVNPSFTPVVSLSASPNTTICAGTLVTFTATASNLGSSSVSTYDFKVNGVSQQSGISNTYTTTSLVNTDIVTCIITVIGGNCITSSTALSNMIIMTVNTNITPTVNIIAFPSGPICVGTSVSFTATASNLGGGSVSIYDFKVNGVSQQTGASNTYATTSLINNDVVTCTITITGGICLTSTTVSSNTITMIVNSSVTPTVAITPSPTGPICAGTSVTFTATASDLGGGSVSTYDFKVNGISQQAGASNNYPTTSLFNGDVVTCTITIIGSGCLTSTTAISNTITMLVNTNVIPSVAITSTPSGAICAGTNVTFTATPTNGGSTPAYQWQVNGVNVGTNSPVYTTNSLNSSDVIKCILTSNYICLTTATVSSNTITMTVNSPVIPSISIGTSANNICTGTLVTFTATPVNGGVSPSYQWKINGINVGSNSPAYSTTGILNGDIVSCVLTNPNSCSTTNTANSNDITMIVTATIIPTLSIVSSANDICPSTPITFTAMPANAGTPPSFQWKLNGADVGTNSIAYINNDLLNGDKISCIMNTVTSCSSSPLVYSDTITMIIKPVPTISFNPAAPAIFHGGSIQLNATIAGSISSYLWTPSTGLSNSTILNPIANPSVTTVYNLNAVAVNGCFVDKQLTVKVFTEIYIPNSFTPNGDGINDIFRIPPGTSLTLQYFIIYDRYGNEILKTNDINKGWDGTYKGKKSPTGVYTYLIKGVDSRSKVLLNGTVILIH